MPLKLNFLDELRAIAQLGINYTKDHYDLERYHKILELVSKEYEELTDLPSEEIRNRFIKDLGYITPKVGVQAAIINPEGKILLDKRADDTCWALPAGWVETNESPEEAIVREIKEETGYIVEVINLVKIYTRKPGQFNQPHGSVHLLYICKYIKGILMKSFESEELKYFKLNECLEISPWHHDHKEQVVDIFLHLGLNS